jgi:hypothetical protein
VSACSATRRAASSTPLSCSLVDNPNQLNPKQVAFMTAPASALSPQVQINGKLLNGHKPPRHIITEELPWHRTAAYLFACGTVTIKDVAQACDVDPATVSNLLRQPWFQERVTDLMAEHGGKDIMTLFRAEQFNSLVTMIDIRDDVEASRRDRLTSAMNILDRTLGKPTQRVETSSVLTSSDPVAEVTRLEAELS